MKKKILFVFPLLIMACVGIFIWRINRLHDVCIKSFDSKAEMIIKNVTHKDVERVGGYVYGFYVKNEDTFYEDYIEQNPSFMYAVNENNQKVLEETGRYVLCVDHRYFCVEADKWDDKLFRYREMMSERPQISNFMADDVGDIISPLVSTDYLKMSDEPEFYSWKDTFGLASFEDLVEFYSRTGDDMYTLKDDEKAILISVYAYGKWHPEAMQIKVREDNSGIEFKLLRYIKEEKIQYDER